MTLAVLCFVAWLSRKPRKAGNSGCNRASELAARALRPFSPTSEEVRDTVATVSLSVKSVEQLADASEIERIMRALPDRSWSSFSLAELEAEAQRLYAEYVSRTGDGDDDGDELVPATHDS
jgi:hypothetical protein